MMIFLLVVIGIVAVGLLWFIASYNNIVRKKNMLDESLSGIAVQQKRRYDLIPNLVNTVSGYSAHESQLLQSITSMRSATIHGVNPMQSMAAESGLSGALKTLFAVAENYPDLKANQNFCELQRELSVIEAELQLARRYYNGVARIYNNAIHTFPSVMVASFFNYKNAEYFVLDCVSQADVPSVKF